MIVIKNDHTGIEMRYVRIEDINLPELEVYTKLSEVQLLRYYEPDIGVFVSESANVVLRALEAGYEPISLLVEDHRLEKEARPVIEMIENTFPKEKHDGITVYVASHELVKDLTGYALVRGLWAVLRRKPLESIEEFIKDKKKIAVLYDIMNPTNAGAIIRSAAALGVDGVILNRAGFTTMAMALDDNSVSVAEPKLKAAEKIAIVLGTEGDGLPNDVIKACTYTVKIPMSHGVDSLNVAAASAVAFWEILKQ